MSILVTENDKIYKRLNVTCLERGESFYQPMLQTLVDDLKVRGEWTSLMGVVK